MGDIILWMSSLESPLRLEEGEEEEEGEVEELRIDESDKANDEQTEDEFNRWINESIKFRPLEELVELLCNELIWLMAERRGLLACNQAKDC